MKKELKQKCFSSKDKIREELTYIEAMNGYTSHYESSSNLYMLSINGIYGVMGKVYYVKLYDTTQVYRDLVPVWKDGVACMYDKQNNVYYSNTKTGTVTCGKIVEPEYE